MRKMHAPLNCSIRPPFYALGLTEIMTV